MNRVPQPPINPALRDAEHHDFWPGFILAVIGLLLIFCGAQHLTAVETVDGGTARETELVKAFSLGGLKYPTVKPPPAPIPDDPVETAAAFERWANTPAPTWKVRVDTEAKTPCPT